MQAITATEETTQPSPYRWRVEVTGYARTLSVYYPTSREAHAVAAQHGDNGRAARVVRIKTVARCWRVDNTRCEVRLHLDPAPT